MLAITSEASRVPRVEVEPPAAGSSDSSATSFEYPSLCSRSRLYFCWVYSAFVLTRTCCLWNSFASSTRPASCSIGPSSRVSSSLSSTTFSRSSSLISPTSCAFASSLPTPASISTPRNQKTSASVDCTTGRAASGSSSGLASRSHSLPASSVPAVTARHSCSSSVFSGCAPAAGGFSAAFAARMAPICFVLSSNFGSSISTPPLIAQKLRERLPTTRSAAPTTRSARLPRRL